MTIGWSAYLAFPVALAGVIFSFQPSGATNLSRYGIFVYSDICTEKESGDEAGHRVVLIRSGNGDELQWVWSGGALEGPAFADSLLIDPKSSVISFSVDIGSQVVEGPGAGQRSVEDPDIQKYRGTISGDRITLKTVEGDIQESLTIPRVKDLSSKTGMCK